MPTKLELIRKNKQLVSRRVFVKRRDTNGDFESEWQRIDFRDGQEVILSFGSIDVEIDADPGQIATFDVSEITLIFDNKNAFFNKEDDPNSFWNGFLSRAYTKIKIEASIEASAQDSFIWGNFVWGDGSTWGGDTDFIVFEGLINTISPNEANQAVVNAFTYNVVLQKYDISDLSLTGNQTASAIITSIMNQSKITKFIPFVTPNPDINPTIISDNLTGTYFNVLRELALLSNSVIFLDGETFAFEARDPTSALVFEFKGAGVSGPQDIYKVTNYDDEGKDRVRLLWLSEGEARQDASVDAELIKKYLQEPQTINLTDISNSTDKDAILAALLAEWEDPKPIIDFRARFLLDLIRPLDKISIEIKGQIQPSQGVFTWGEWAWGDGSQWGKSTGSIIISDDDRWMITSIKKDLDAWNMLIRAEKIA